MSSVDRVRAVLGSPLGAPVRVLYSGVLRLQVVAVGMLDAVRSRGGSDRGWLAEQLSVSAKTFLRPATARRMVRTVRRVFDGDVVIADDSPTPLAPPDARCRIVALPFNSGVTVGRNAALAEVRTPFVLVTDDDVVFTRASDLERAVRFLLDHPEVDAVCAFQVELPRWYAVEAGDESELFPGHRPLRIPHGTEIDGTRVVAKGPTAYVGRTEALRQVPYDEKIRMVDHRDFFSSAAGRLVFVQARWLVVYHARTPFNRSYNQHRDDVHPDLYYLGSKWG